MCRSKRQRGQIILFVMLAMIPICMVIGLVVDGGLAYYTKTSARTAAQTAALAAVQGAMDSIYQGGTYTCGSGSLGCQSPAACPTTGNLATGCLYATANGFTTVTGGPQSVLIDANTTAPPVTNLTTANYWVRVQIVQKNWLTFGAMSGLPSITAGATAIAAAVNVMPINCVVALNPSASNAVDLIGHVNLTTTDCGVAVNSNSSTALTTNGNTILSASSISVVGGTDTAGSVDPTPTTGVAPFRDPLEGVPAPTVPSGCSHPTPTTANGVTTYYPGNYCSPSNSPLLSFGNNSTSVLSPGTYFLIGGGLSLSGNASLTGTGVTFYNTFNSTYGYGPISMAGTPSGSLSAPTSGPLQGILFFEDRNAPTGNPSTIKGNSTFNISGAVYLPKNGVTFSGDATSQQLMLVASTVTMNGNVTLTINPESGSGPLTPQISAALIQ